MNDNTHNYNVICVALSALIKEHAEKLNMSPETLRDTTLKLASAVILAGTDPQSAIDFVEKGL